MSDNQWAFDFKNIMFSVFTAKLKAEFGEKYSNMLVTQDEEQESTATFPTFLMQQVSWLEAGQTLEGNTINAIRPTFQITVTNKGNRAEIEKLALYAAMIFKDKRFELSNVHYGIENKVRTAVFRASRVIGAGDSI